jgi:hypothetical protein
MDAKTYRIYIQFMCDEMKHQMPWVDISDPYSSILKSFCEYIYDYDPLLIEYPEDYDLPEGFYDYIVAEYSKYCAIRDPKEDAKLSARQNADTIKVIMDDGEIREYPDTDEGLEDFMYDFCPDIRDVAGDAYASEEIDEVAKEIFNYEIKDGQITFDELCSIAAEFLPYIDDED